MLLPAYMFAIAAGAAALIFLLLRKLPVDGAAFKRGKAGIDFWWNIWAVVVVVTLYASIGEAAEMTVRGFLARLLGSDKTQMMVVAFFFTVAAMRVTISALEYRAYAARLRAEKAAKG